MGAIAGLGSVPELATGLLFRTRCSTVFHSRAGEGDASLVFLPFVVLWEFGHLDRSSRSIHTRDLKTRILAVRTRVFRHQHSHQRRRVLQFHHQGESAAAADASAGRRSEFGARDIWKGFLGSGREADYVRCYSQGWALDWWVFFTGDVNSWSELGC